MQKAAPPPCCLLKTGDLVQSTGWPTGPPPSPGHKAAASTGTAPEPSSWICTTSPTSPKPTSMDRTPTSRWSCVSVHLPAGFDAFTHLWDMATQAHRTGRANRKKENSLVHITTPFFSPFLLLRPPIPFHTSWFVVQLKTGTEVSRPSKWQLKGRR